MTIVSEQRWVRTAQDSVTCEFKHVSFVLVPTKTGHAALYMDDRLRVLVEDLRYIPDTKYRYQGYGQDGVHYTVYISPDQQEVYIGFHCTNIAITKIRCR